MISTVFETREVAVLVSALLLVLCSLRFVPELRRVPAARTLALAMAALVVGHCATVIEHFAYYEAFNRIEHAAYCLQSLALAYWAFSVVRRRNG